jgi:hypothetical protein
MTHASGDDWTPGQPVRVETKAVGPIEVDCSKWDADIPEDKWFHGRLEGAVHPLAPARGVFVLCPASREAPAGGQPSGGASTVSLGTQGVVDLRMHISAIMANLNRRYAAVADSFVDEVFEKEFLLSEHQRDALLQRIERSQQEQMRMIELVFDGVELDEPVRDSLALLEKHSSDFWHALGRAIPSVNGNEEIGTQRTTEKAAASASLHEMRSALTCLARVSSGEFQTSSEKSGKSGVSSDRQAR